MAAGIRYAIDTYEAEWDSEEGFIDDDWKAVLYRKLVVLEKEVE
jgi:hypothetical protein